jgi:hypothetical protein
MITVSGIAAEGPPAVDETRRIAAESVSPQHVAVLWTDTELHFALIPVICRKIAFDFPSTKVIIIFHPASKKQPEISVIKR